MTARRTGVHCNPLYTGDFKMRTLANNEDPDEMRHDAALSSGFSLFAKSKTIFRKRMIQLFLKIITYDPSIEEPTHVYCIKPE